VVKTRLQVSGTGGRDYKSLGIGGTIRITLKEEGILAFWKGIGAAWMREASYTSLRLGLYGPIKHAMGVTSKSNFFMKFSAGSLAGAIGSIVGNPFDVLKTVSGNTHRILPFLQCMQRMMTSEGKEPPSMGQAASTLYKAQVRCLHSHVSCSDTSVGHERILPWH
jgi:hypothetical protein